MVVASYYGGNTENPEIDYTNWNEWVHAIREDFRKFIDYRLNNIDNSDKLVKKLKSVSKNLSNTCPLGQNYLREFNFIVGEDYSIIEYPIYDREIDRYNMAYAIISRDYKRFIFVDSINSAPSVTLYEIDKKVTEEKFIPGIDLVWGESCIEENLKYLRGDVSSVRELGGFADDPEDVDGNFQAFNYCMASDYAYSMYNEDFENLGYMDSSLFGTIAHWLNYDGKIGANEEEFILNIPRGEFLTTFNRTFADAVAARRLGELAESLIINGNNDPKLYFTAIAYSEPSDSILNRVLGDLPGIEQYVSFVNELMSLINQEYKGLDEDESHQFILKIKKYLRNMVVSQTKSFLENNYGYEWFDEAFGIKGRERKLSDQKPNS